MIHYDHAMVGATLALASGVQKKYGWPAVLLGALMGACPDWDAATKHVAPDLYERGHRVWGHNLFAVTLAGAALGALGHLVHRSNRPAEKGGLAAWLALGVCVALSHPLLDVLYCGLDRGADWPVRLVWPLAETGAAVPWVPWHDRGATAVLAVGLAAAAVAARRQAVACWSLAALVAYVAARGLLR